MRQKHWKRDTERLWSASPFDVGQAAALALPSLRGACLKSADQISRNVAWRRFGAVRDVLHALDVPRFGKRAAMPAPEPRHRRLLGLPSGRQLADSEIQQSYKRAVKRPHPDAGAATATSPSFRRRATR